jgi:hypothetical protein
MNIDEHSHCTPGMVPDANPDFLGKLVSHLTLRGRFGAAVCVCSK